MSLTINLILGSSEYDLLNLFDENIDMNSSQLVNFSTYIEQSKKCKNPKNVITNHENIIQAINYDSDENNNYWIILDKKFNFMDVGIPLSGDLSNEKLYEDLSSEESEILKSLKDVLN